MGSISDLKSPILGIFKLKYSLVLVITLDKRALVYGKSYNEDGNFEPVVLTSTDLNRFFGKSDKIMDCCICNKEFLLVKYQPNGLASVNFDDLENGISEKPPIFHFIIFRISKLAKVMKIDDSWEKMEEDDGYSEKHHAKLLAVIDRSSPNGAEYLGFLVKFYSYSSDRLFLNFWKLNQYGRFDGTTFKYLIAEKLQEDDHNSLILDIKHGYGYDYLRVKYSKSKQIKVLRLVFNSAKIFDQTEDVIQELKMGILSDEQNKLVEELKIKNRNQLKEGEQNGIMDMDDMSDWSQDSDNLGAEKDVMNMFEKAEGLKVNHGFKNKIGTSHLGNDPGMPEKSEFKI